eukprot:TRINITY_DN11728_c0_g1_i1.p2 TRINITY_DN11728_c0_g1~~TRINITY_DN11728_c0_g1_i1.p2  ORF type:complete len:126 (-),score=38.39 TRINITY_DN11728_c0_g1_i1:605-982(-)
MFYEATIVKDVKKGAKKVPIRFDGDDDVYNIDTTKLVKKPPNIESKKSKKRKNTEKDKGGAPRKKSRVSNDEDTNTGAKPRFDRSVFRNHDITAINFGVLGKKVKRMQSVSTTGDKAKGASPDYV